MEFVGGPLDGGAQDLPAELVNYYFATPNKKHGHLYEKELRITQGKVTAVLVYCGVRLLPKR